MEIYIVRHGETLWNKSKRLQGNRNIDLSEVGRNEARERGKQLENVDFDVIVGIPLLIKAIILGIQNILEVLLEDIGILKMESIFLHTNITIIPHSVLYVSLSYYIINPCTSASSNFDDSFS